MQRLIRLTLTGLFCVAIAAGAVIWVLDLAPPFLKGLGANSRRNSSAGGSARD